MLVPTPSLIVSAHTRPELWAQKSKWTNGNIKTVRSLWTTSMWKYEYEGSLDPTTYLYQAVKTTQRWSVVATSSPSSSLGQSLIEWGASRAQVAEGHDVYPVTAWVTHVSSGKNVECAKSCLGLVVNFR